MSQIVPNHGPTFQMDQCFCFTQLHIFPSENLTNINTIYIDLFLNDTTKRKEKSIYTKNLHQKKFIIYEPFISNLLLAEALNTGTCINSVTLCQLPLE